MGWAITLGKVVGTEVRVHVTFIFVLVWFCVNYYRQGGIPATLSGLLFVSCVFICVLLHELAHVGVARHFGISTLDITLLPLGGVARFARVPDRPLQELAVILAGPAVNTIIGVVLFLIVSPLTSTELTNLVGPNPNLLAQLLYVNGVLVVFNLIPAFPLDGGRALRALLMLRLEREQATKITAGVGKAVANGFIFLGVLYNPGLILIAVFLYVGANREVRSVYNRATMPGPTVSSAIMSEFHVLPLHATLDEAVGVFLGTSQNAFLVMDTAKVRGILTRRAVMAALLSQGLDTPIASLMHADVPTVYGQMAMDEAVGLMRRGYPALPVVDDSHHVVGMLTLENASLRLREATARKQIRGLT